MLLTKLKDPEPCLAYAEAALEVGGDDFSVDLLFSRLRLRRHVVIEVMPSFDERFLGLSSCPLAARESTSSASGAREARVVVMLACSVEPGSPTVEGVRLLRDGGRPPSRPTG